VTRPGDPSVLTTTFLVQQRLVLDAVVDRLEDRFKGKVVLSRDLGGCQWFSPNRFAIQHFGTNAAIDEKLFVI